MPIESDITEIIQKYYNIIKKIFPVRRVILYGSHVKGNANDESDIDVGVVIDFPDHLKRIDITADLFHYAVKVDPRIEPKCIFLDEYLNPEKASILSEIVRTSKIVA